MLAVTLLGFSWFTLDHGHLLLGFVIGMLFAKALQDWPTSGWIAAGIFLGIVFFGLTAHFLHWFR